MWLKQTLKPGGQAAQDTLPFPVTRHMALSKHGFLATLWCRFLESRISFGNNLQTKLKKGQIKNNTCLVSLLLNATHSYNLVHMYLLEKFLSKVFS
jgi:hypothetical protein